MTKYVLQSGGLKGKRDKIFDCGKKYFTEVFKDLSNNPKILWCFFATLPDDANIRFEKYTKLFQENYYPKLDPQNTLATLEDFAYQVKESDVVYLHGGIVQTFMNILENYDFKNLFEDKVIACNSATSMSFCDSYWSCETREPGKGFGLFPMKYIAHSDSDYGSDDPRGPIDWDAAYKELEAYGDTSLPIHALEEGDFVVYNL